jgi:hypothetical protein
VSVASWDEVAALRGRRHVFVNRIIEAYRFLFVTGLTLHPPLCIFMKYNA